MKDYELTERGKIVICVVLVLLIFIIPATVFAVRAWNNSPPQPAEPPASSVPGPDDTVISNGPLPDGSGFDPHQPTKPEDGEQGSFDPVPEPPDDPEPEPDEEHKQEPSDDLSQEPEEDLTPEPEKDLDREHPEQPPEVGPVDINRSEGTMSFTFAPGHQDDLDADSIAMLSTFLSSPRNTKDAEIIIEIPQMPDDNRSVVVSAVINAFASHGVSRDILTFRTYQTGSHNGPQVISMAFHQPEKSPK